MNAPKRRGFLGIEPELTSASAVKNAAKPTIVLVHGAFADASGWNLIAPALQWYMVAKNDRIIPPEAERAMAARAGSTIVDVNSSHVPMISQPAKVISMILSAAK